MPNRLLQAPLLTYNPEQRKTLIFCPIGLGNFIMVSPAIKLLSESIGKTNLHILALKSGVRDMAEASGYFGKVYFWNPDSGSKAAGLSVIMQLRGEKYDYSISLFPTGDWRFSLVSYLIYAKQRIGFQYPNSNLPERVQTYSHRLNPDLHDIDQNCALIEKLLGIDIKLPRIPVFPFAEADLNNIPENYYVCHPGSSAERGMSEKRLPPSIFADVINRIGAKYGLKCYLVGGPEESDLRREISAIAPEWVIDNPTQSFNELSAVIGNSLFYLGNDSGLMHISVAKGKRCIAIFGPTDDRRNGPYADKRDMSQLNRHLIIRNNKLDCSPCWTIRTIGANPPCKFGDTRCMHQMDIDHVWHQIETFINDSQLELKTQIKANSLCK